MYKNGLKKFLFKEKKIELTAFFHFAGGLSRPSAGPPEKIHPARPTDG